MEIDENGAIRLKIRPHTCMCGKPCSVTLEKENLALEARVIKLEDIARQMVAAVECGQKILMDWNVYKEAKEALAREGK